MKDYADIDDQIGELLSRDLPVPEHREGYREHVATLVTAKALARTGEPKRVGRLPWLTTTRREERAGRVQRAPRPTLSRSSGLRTIAVALAVLVLFVGVGAGLYEAATHLKKNGPVLVLTNETVPTAVMSAAELGLWKADTITFAGRLFGAWPDVDATVAQYTDDATWYDPSDGAPAAKGKQDLASMYRSFFYYCPGVQAHSTQMYLSADGAAYRLVTQNLWPPGQPEPADHLPTVPLEVFRLRDGLAASDERWFSGATLETVGFGVFAPGGGGPAQLRNIADRYVAAWSSGEKGQIAALYRDDAVFSDSMLGLQAQGPAAIAQLADKRFGTGSHVSLEVADLYVQTNGPDPPTAENPGQGAIIGVGIHYRCTMVVAGRSVRLDGLTTFELGTRQGETFSVDSNRLITREEVFYNPDSLVSAGLVR